MRRVILFCLIVISARTAAAQSSIPAPAPLSTFAYDTRAPLNPRDSLYRQVDGIEVRSISFDAPHGGRVTGLLYLPATTGRHPAMLVGHGAPGDSRGYGTMTLALAMARSGAVVLSIDAPFARAQREPLAFTPLDSIDRVRYVAEWRRGVDLLAARADVDPARIGYIGNSFGGAIGAVLVGVEPRLRAAVLRVGDGGFVAHFTYPCTGGDSVRVGHVCTEAESPVGELEPARREAWYRALWPLEGGPFLARATAPVMLQNARRDEAVRPASAQRLQDAAPASAVREWYDSGHRLPNDALFSSLRFLHDHLGMQAPDDAFTSWLAVRTAPPSATAPRP